MREEVQEVPRCPRPRCGALLKHLLGDRYQCTNPKCECVVRKVDPSSTVTRGGDDG